MDRLKVERVGGIAGFGLPGSRLKSRGEVALSALPATDQHAVEALFKGRGKPKASTPGPTPDGFRYRITRQTPKGPKTIEVAEEHLPQSVIDSVKDELE